MDQKIMKNALHPIRMRILQHIIVNKEATASDISKQLQDIPQATLYRHINKLEAIGLIEIVSENRIRGTVERVYSIGKKYEGGHTSNKDSMQVLFTFLMTLLSDFQHYFEKEEVDPRSDMLFAQMALLNLSDEEFTAFLNEIQEAYKKVVDNVATEERKIRRVSMISSPIHKF